MTRRLLHVLIVAGTILPRMALSAQPQAADGSLVATVRIADRKFCLGTPIGGHASARELDPDAISINLGVRVSYRNVAVNPVILLLLNDWRVVLSPRLEDAAQLKNQVVVPYYESNPTPPWGPGDLPVLDAERPEPNLFRIVPPGGVLDPEGLTHISFQVHKPSADGTGAELLGKKVYFQLELDHALIPDNVERALQARWRRYGILWEGKIRTQPIELNIPQSPKASQCESNERID
jgi:hypothetical protein